MGKTRLNFKNLLRNCENCVKSPKTAKIAIFNFHRIFTKLFPKVGKTRLMREQNGKSGNRKRGCKIPRFHPFEQMIIINLVISEQK